MSKKLKEAWNGLLDDIKRLEVITSEEQQREILNKLDVIRPHVATPTSEEVCEAIKKDFPTLNEVTYQNGRFYNKDENDIMILTYADDTLDMCGYSFSVQTLLKICRFYEELEK